MIYTVIGFKYKGNGKCKDKWVCASTIETARKIEDKWISKGYESVSICVPISSTDYTASKGVMADCLKLLKDIVKSNGGNLIVQDYGLLNRVMCDLGRDDVPFKDEPQELCGWIKAGSYVPKNTGRLEDGDVVFSEDPIDPKWETPAAKDAAIPVYEFHAVITKQGGKS